MTEILAFAARSLFFGNGIIWGMISITACRAVLTSSNLRHDGACLRRERMARYIESAGHTAQHVREIGMKEADDQVIWNHVVAHGW